MIVILTTCAPKDASALLRSLLERRLVACGNVIPGVQSTYWWEGAIHTDEECVVLMETTEARRSAALKSLEALHPYDVPKILHWSPEANTSYKHWLAEVTQG